MIQGIHANEQLLQHQQSAAEPAVQWQQPPPRFMKCNVDASFYDTSEATRRGWCLHDYRGRFILAGTNLMHTKLNSLEGEAMTIKEAIEEMMQRGLSYVIFERDSKVAVDAIHSRHDGLSEFNILISHIKNLLMSNNNEVKFVSDKLIG
ncbi:cytochrome p450 [Trifolium pratense]|uniref:Cytochrome p450 n=1 Tax=Trifolium pratense TaxID=57577 RepID=A0A2K3MW38_TRIPR|nr:cytochrome p450 [Trifolium pratense]